MLIMLGVIWLAAVTLASPVIPDAPILADRGVVVIESSVLRVHKPETEQAIKTVHEEKKDENEAEEPDIKVLDVLPEAPILPPLDENILENLKKAEIITSEESTKPQVEISEIPKDEEPEVVDVEKNDILEKEGVQDKVEEIAAAEEPVNVKWSIPSPPFLGNVISSLQQLAIPLPTINWPI